MRRVGVLGVLGVMGVMGVLGALGVVLAGRPRAGAQLITAPPSTFSVWAVM